MPAATVRPGVTTVGGVSLMATEVTVVDVRMPFGSMLTFMVKWALASIPAFLILFFIGFVVGSMLLGAAGVALPRPR
jgi:hypothetical protein